MLSRCRAGSLRADWRFVLVTVGCWLLVEVPRGWANPGDPPKEAVAKAMESGERAWAYRPVVRPELPETTGAEVSPIDRLLAKRRAEKGVETTSPARPAELLRRLKFDLLGLPPTPEELAQFEVDSSDSAYRQWVETWLASPHYGERWGRIWLDLVRYSDTAGYNADPLRPLAWKYRDYVISAFNNDTPYDRFLSEQIAGDELYPESQAALVGTGFLRLPPDESNASDVVLARQDTLNDLTAAVGSVLLGQSLGCAQCHDHKYDPLAQKEYYSLQAFFAAVIPVEKQVAVSTPEVQAAVEALRKWEADTHAKRVEFRTLQTQIRARVYAPKRLRFPELVWQAMDTLPGDRTAYQHQLAFFSERQLIIEIKEKEFLAAMTAEEKSRYDGLKAEVDALEKQRPRLPGEFEAMVATDGREIPPTHLLDGGNVQKPLDELSPGFPQAMAFGFDSEAALKELQARYPQASRRALLARWLTDPRHPLVARVMANRLWQGHFGEGLVENANDFGVQTAPPAVPELLDWLAAELVQPTVDTGGEAAPWSLKHLHRVILLSSTYRLATLRPASHADIATSDAGDPANHLFWHYPRRRLDAESIRDALLAVSGQLNPQVGGAPIKPELPAAIGNKGLWELSPPEQRTRRSIYILQKRNLPFPMLQAFDLPETFESCACRAQTVTAPQALLLLNSDVVLTSARDLAGELLRKYPSGNLEELVPAAYRLAFGRSPATDEVSAATDFIERQSSLLAVRETTDRAARLPRPYPKFLDASRAAAIVDFCHALLNANEFVYTD
jgi:hypothetical protein